MTKKRLWECRLWYVFFSLKKTPLGVPSSAEPSRKTPLGVPSSAEPSRKTTTTTTTIALAEPKQSGLIGPIRIPIARLQFGFLPIRIPISIRFFLNHVSCQHVCPMFLITLCFVSILIGSDQAQSSPIAEIVHWPKFPD